MIYELHKIIGVLGIFSILFAYSEWIYQQLQIRVEYTRKLVHVLTGIIALSFPIVFDKFSTVMTLCLIFVILLVYIERRKLLGSITDIKRQSSGSIYFPIAVVLCFGFYALTGKLVYYLIPLSLLTFCDPLAAIIGQSVPSRKFHFGNNQKSIAGVIAYCVSSIIVITTVFMFLKLPVSIAAVLIIMTMTCLAEILSQRGADNIFIPLSASLSLFLLNH